MAQSSRASGSPEVTVVIPTRDRWEFLSAALSTSLGQQNVELEVVVVDDASTDETRDRLEGLSDPRLRVIRHAACVGVAKARNSGIEQARGQWIAFLDDDDLWAPHKLREQLDEGRRTKALFAYAAAVLLDEHRRAFRTYPAPDPAGIERQLLANYVIPAGSSNVVARTAVLRELGGFDERLFQLTDWDLWLRLARKGPAAACSDVLVAYVVHSRNMLLEDRRDVVREFDYLVEKHRASSRASGVEFDRVAFSRWVAGGHRRSGRRADAARIYLASGLRCRNPGNLARAVSVLLRKKPSGACGFPSGTAVSAPPGWLAGHP